MIDNQIHILASTLAVSIEQFKAISLSTLSRKAVTDEITAFVGALSSVDFDDAGKLQGLFRADSVFYHLPWSTMWREKRLVGTKTLKAVLTHSCQQCEGV